MQFLLDSNVVSELWKPLPSVAVLSWVSSAEWLVPVVVIAAMAVRHGMRIASRNYTDFRHGVVFDPWTGKDHAPRE